MSCIDGTVRLWKKKSYDFNNYRNKIEYIPEGLPRRKNMNRATNNKVQNKLYTSIKRLRCLFKLLAGGGVVILGTSFTRLRCVFPVLLAAEGLPRLCFVLWIVIHLHCTYCFQGVSLDLVERKWEHIVVYSNYGNIIMSSFWHGPTRGSPSSMDGGWGGTVSFWVDLNLNWLCECVWLSSISLVDSWWPCFFMGRFLPASRHGPTRGHSVSVLQKFCKKSIEISHDFHSF